MHREISISTGLAGMLYVAGGFSGSECLSTAESFNPLTSQWTVLKPMNCQRSGVTLVSFQNAVYAIGGFNGTVRLDEGKVTHTQLQNKQTTCLTVPSVILTLSNTGSN